MPQLSPLAGRLSSSPLVVVALGEVAHGGPYRLGPPAPLDPVVAVPDDAPEDLRELLQALAFEVPALLRGLDPVRIGVTLVHPDSNVQIDGAAGCIVARLDPVTWMQERARVAGNELAPRPGYFLAVLLGREGRTWWWHVLAPRERGPAS